MKKILASSALAVSLLFAGLSVPASAAPAPVSAPESTVVLTPPPLPKVAGQKPVGVHAVKGKVGLRKSAVPPSVSALAGTNFFRYAGARQFLGTGQTANSFAANLHVDPLAHLDTARGDYHTLGEISVQSEDGKQTVEIGVTKDPILCAGTNKVCLFVYWWKNGVPQCYNGCGFVDYASNPVNAGADISADAGPQRFQIAFSSNVWWVAYKGSWVGYFPHTLWTNSTPSGPSVNFTAGNKFQGFYEAATAVDKTCTDLANGLPTSDGNAARVGSMSLTGKVPSTIVDNFSPFAQPGVPDGWPTSVVDSVSLSTTTVRAGGPMWNLAGTAAGSTHAC